MGFEEERRPAAPAEAGGCAGELHQERHPERGERTLVERLASLVVGNGEADVIEGTHLRNATGPRPRRSCHRHGVGKPPLSPYPPDLDDGQPAAVAELGDLIDVVVEDADWANTSARRLSARRAELRQCRLTGVELAEATLSDVAFLDCRLDLAGLRMAKLERVVFRDCQMTECDFYEASLTDVLFERCTLREATFSAVKLKRVELRGCDLFGIHGVEALRGARIPSDDVLENAVLFAVALGLEIVD